MKELNEELWKLGIMAKTEHNEVAPAQHELAPFFTTTNISADQMCIRDSDTALPRRCIRAGVMTAHPDELAAVLPSLLASAERLRTLRDKTSSLQQRLDDSRIVARAKLLLISHLGMSEGDAHRYIEKTAMDSCLPRRDVAEGIIRTYEE